MFLGVWFGLVLGKSLLQRKNPGHRIDGSRFRRCLSENDEHQHGLMNNATKRGWDGRYKVGHRSPSVWWIC